MKKIHYKNQRIKKFSNYFLVVTASFLISLSAASQNVGVNPNQALPDASAGLDIDFNNKGLLVPRLTTAQRDAILNPTMSLLIFNTETVCFEAWNSNSSAWVAFGCLSSTPEFNECGDLFTDVRDNNTYQTVKIGDQCWMKENARYLPSVVSLETIRMSDPLYYVYDYDGTDVDEAKAMVGYSTYGALYNWNSAKYHACPEGWHLPDESDWCELGNFVEPNTNPGCRQALTYRGTTTAKKLKAVSPAWDGTDTHGFAALPAGAINNNEFQMRGTYTRFWSEEDDWNKAWSRSLSADDRIYQYSTPKAGAYSVRCVQD